jgi:hypothetical protein
LLQALRTENTMALIRIIKTQQFQRRQLLIPALPWLIPEPDSRPTLTGNEVHPQSAGGGFTKVQLTVNDRAGQTEK